jgi:transcriptional regulator with XRE-family HTH domain
MFEIVEIKDVKRELGALVKALRKQRNLSETQLAERIDVSRTTIQNLELGKNFTVDTFLKVMKEMDLLTQIHQEVVDTKNHVTNTKSLY